jgi:hypothetical protein
MNIESYDLREPPAMSVYKLKKKVKSPKMDECEHDLNAKNRTSLLRVCSSMVKAEKEVKSPNIFK